MAEKKENESVLDLYHRTKNVFYDASEFLHALDILFVLNLIDVDDNSGKVKYA